MLHNLQKLQDIIINPADKGGAVVLWYWDHYTEEAAKQMAELCYIKKLHFFFHSEIVKLFLQHEIPYIMHVNCDEIRLGKMPEFTNQILRHPTIAS